MITIVLADDHTVVRQGIRAMLKTERDFDVAGESDHGLDAVSLVMRLQPAILVCDLTMPGLNGIEVTERIAKLSPKTRVVILSMHSSTSYVSSALQAGAKGYVLKESGVDELAHAIREVNAGRTYLSPPLSEEAIMEYRQKAITTQWDPGP
jgi:DNA-binding NarL/FixJ family response regulator